MRCMDRLRIHEPPPGFRLPLDGKSLITRWPNQRPISLSYEFPTGEGASAIQSSMLRRQKSLELSRG